MGWNGASQIGAWDLWGKNAAGKLISELWEGKVQTGGKNTKKGSSPG